MTSIKFYFAIEYQDGKFTGSNTFMDSHQLSDDCVVVDNKPVSYDCVSQAVKSRRSATLLALEEHLREFHFDIRETAPWYVDFSGECLEVSTAVLNTSMLMENFTTFLENYGGDQFSRTAKTGRDFLKKWGNFGYSYELIDLDVETSESTLITGNEEDAEEADNLVWETLFGALVSLGIKYGWSFHQSEGNTSLFGMWWDSEPEEEEGFPF